MHINIVIPMAGRGSRFANAGFDVPKPLIDVAGQPMVQRVVRNLTPLHHNYGLHVICQREIASDARLQGLRGNQGVAPTVHVLDGYSDGAARTCLTATKELGDEPLMIANSDQWIDLDIDEVLDAFEAEETDGLIVTMQADDDRWSFVRVNEDGLVIEVAEKEPISSNATVGLYLFKSVASFNDAVERMIQARSKVNDEYYVAPAYNELIRSGARLTTIDLGPLSTKMFGLGTPDDLAHFLNLHRAAALPARWYHEETLY